MTQESYFSIAKKEQREILEFYRNELSISEHILEKDIWLCWVLDIIFNIPNKHPMAFKGGTSLSKVFNAINRFSEDIDLTLDYRYFDISGSFDPKMSKSKAKIFSEKLKERVKEYSYDVILSTLKDALDQISQDYHLSIDDSGEKIWIYYPSVLQNENTNKYIKEAILLELGGRNVIDPNETHIVEPYIKNTNIKFPQPKITVLSPQRTFWEKVTLIHVECNRGIRANAERMSRHWYDLVKLFYNKEIGELAIKNSTLLEDVIKHKSFFFNSSYANYDDCLNNKFKLKPDENGLSELADDYANMCRAGMIYDSDEMDFDYIMQKINEISKILNKINE